MLKSCDGSLLESYDLAMFDLDGVVYVSGAAIDGVPDRLRRVREAGVHLAFVTNNASRTPEKVAANLDRLGIEAQPTDVVTSAQAAARVVRERFGAGAHVLLLGGAGLEAALEAEDLVAQSEPDDDTVVVVSGYGPDVLWKDIMRAATLVKGGLPYVASNTDMTIPTDYGQAPGHGMLVRAISEFAGIEPVVAGKPSRPLLDETVRRVGGQRPLMVGDRLDTDIEGAHAVEVDSLLVMTGVTHLAELVAAGPGERPTYVSADLEGLFEPHRVPEAADGTVELGGWTARVLDGRLQVDGDGAASDFWRAVAVAGWTHLDETGEAASVDGVSVPEVPGPGEHR
ncbi:HAD-IIA family hydrolase [Nocardioides sp. Soil805]|uniref:HAD-IIA family hydrolase n=1 Tax=Nocardioides sp. Soil805 TaxID=1736416 RepID=UPI00070264EB|nr:HAD-IIA family hydrolase [Nocardioides sp. Soil805]KRF32469.1 HAD family hydrolase [Nocardioides sp. Soil805]